MNRDMLEAELAQLPLCNYRFLKPETLEFSDRVRWICAHECPMYGKSWACPPGVGTVEECRARCLRYSECLLIATMTEVSDLANMTETLKTRFPHERITDAVAALLRKQKLSPYVLSTQACTLCEHCSCPDGPCRHPEQMHPCVESHGINLLPVIAEMGMEFQAGSNLVTWFSLLFYSE